MILKNKMFVVFGVLAFLKLGLSQAQAAEVQVPQLKASVQTSDGKPIACARFSLTVALEHVALVGRYLPRPSWITENLVSQPVYSDQNGKVIIEAFKIKHDISGLKRTPYYILNFDGVYPQVDGKCGPGSSEVAQVNMGHRAKRLGKNWSLDESGCVTSDKVNIRKPEVLDCETQVDSSQFTFQNALLAAALAERPSEEAKQFSEEFEKGFGADLERMQDLLGSGKIPYDKPCAGATGCWGLEPLTLAITGKTLLDTEVRQGLLEALMKLGSHFSEKNLYAQTPLHVLFYNSGALEVLKSIESALPEQVWQVADLNGRLPLYSAVVNESNGPQLVEYVLGIPAVRNSINQKDVFGLRARDHFYRLRLQFNPKSKPYQEIDRLLEQAGAEPVSL